MPRVSIPPSFKRIFDELPEKKRKRVAKALRLFQHDQNYPSLNFERLQGAEGYYSIRASLADRIVLRKVEEDHYEAADIGGHEVYRALRR